jgi:hypothetical protein
LPPQHLFELLLLLGVEAGIFDEAVDVFVEVRVDQFQLRRAILIEQRYRRAVLYRLLEVACVRESGRGLGPRGQVSRRECRP